MKQTEQRKVISKFNAMTGAQQRLTLRNDLAKRGYWLPVGNDKGKINTVYKIGKDTPEFKLPALFSSYQYDILAFIRRNRNKEIFHIVTDKHTSSGTNFVKVYILYKGEMRNITNIIALLIDVKLHDYGTIRLGFINMDNRFNLVYTIGQYMGYKSTERAFQYYIAL